MVVNGLMATLHTKIGDLAILFTTNHKDYRSVLVLKELKKCFRIIGGKEFS
jgi:hypothetical protein